ncbi:undecaprenyl-diphosphate phosphatase [Sulfuracidifex metallicus]|uniref:undecaprenyl-diphosphate phosphatase n=1 Tax=Sulfuracidifex metallicus TaxID=47303 RepID=UPI00227250C8|nr:undecaprenyl-diphosphate phosphatase [Sulfuracidifex metallicus]MCY0850661.1 undecaprenyl-diphosphate phosphatase [Sulfuracidifex metallicus]
MNPLILGVILGVVQGISEWIPISSKTQILIVSYFVLGLGFASGYAFGLFMEIGTLAAAIIYFRRELYSVVLAIFRKGKREDKVLLRYLIITTIITGLMGVPIYLFIVNLVKGPIIGIPMMILGFVLIIDGITIYFTRKSYIPKKELLQLTWKDYFIVGLAQGLAALPGVSRSGMTTSALILLGVKPQEAFRLSFLALIPASIGAIGVTLLFSRHTIESTLGLVSYDALGISILVATLVSLVLIESLLKFARSNKILLLVFTLGILALISGLISSVTGFG